jgi:hypothetical protein
VPRVLFAIGLVALYSIVLIERWTVSEQER